MANPMPIRIALLSVSDKTNLVSFAQCLVQHGVTILSTGGTASTLSRSGITVKPIEQVTGVPEMMDGRIKTLHPKVHGGLLAVRDNPDHQQAMELHGIKAIDLVCINLYPFEQTIASPQVRDSEAIEQIDIGGPTMIRSAAKNHRFVTCITDPAQYDPVINELGAQDGATSLELRRQLAATAFARTCQYDSAIATWLKRRNNEQVISRL